MRDRLKSRKFWLAVVGVLAGLCLAVYGTLTHNPEMTNQGVNLIMASVVAYMAAEGTADVVTRSKQAEIEKLVTLAKLDATMDSGGSEEASSGGIVNGGDY